MIIMITSHPTTNQNPRVISSTLRSRISRCRNQLISHMRESVARCNCRAAILAILLALAPAVTFAQGTISPSPFLTAFDNSGNIINGACIWTYLAGTTTAVATYTNVTLSSSNSNPIQADSAGRFTAFLTPGTSYKFVYESACTPPAHGTTLRTADNIIAVPSNSGGVDVIGTAGEALTAGNAVYLSDGSGSKVAGQWYKADSANTYSSLENPVGMVAASIASGATGTIRLSGTISGLAGLTIGSLYYVSTSGAITSTAPGNARILGKADTTSSLVVSDANPIRQLVDPGLTEGRLTLTTATPVTTADVTAATTIYFTPYKGAQLALFTAASVWTRHTFAQISIAVPSTTNTLYDVFVYDNSGVITLELTAWTNDTTRATALAFQDGVYVKSGATTRKYLGSVRTTGVSGQTEDSYAKRYVWNYYNRVVRPMRVMESTDTWNYTTTTYRQANANAANQLDCVIGVAEVLLDAHVQATAANSTGATFAQVAIGQDSTSAPATGLIGMQFALSVANTGTFGGADLLIYPAVGRHVYVWLERGDGTGTVTWSGDAGAPTVLQSGIFGSIQG